MAVIAGIQGRPPLLVARSHSSICHHLSNNRHRRSRNTSSGMRTSLPCGLFLRRRGWAVPEAMSIRCCCRTRRLLPAYLHPRPCCRPHYTLFPKTSLLIPAPDVDYPLDGGTTSKNTCGWCILVSGRTGATHAATASKRRITETSMFGLYTRNSSPICAPVATLHLARSRTEPSMYARYMIRSGLTRAPPADVCSHTRATSFGISW